MPWIHWGARGYLDTSLSEDVLIPPRCWRHPLGWLVHSQIAWLNGITGPSRLKPQRQTKESWKQVRFYLLLPSICCPSSVYPLTHHYPLWFQAFADKNPQISTDLPGQSHPFWVPLDRWASEEQLRTSNTKGSGKRPDNPDVDRRRHMAGAVKSSQS